MIVWPYDKGHYSSGSDYPRNRALNSVSHASVEPVASEVVLHANNVFAGLARN
jgi:hypothetical protein